jgi:hypothetical protein
MKAATHSRTIAAVNAYLRPTPNVGFPNVPPHSVPNINSYF